MDFLLIIAWLFAMTALPATLVLLVQWVLVAHHHTPTMAELKMFLDLPEGNIKKGAIPHSSLSALPWLRENPRLSSQLEEANRKAGVHFPLSGREIYCWLILQSRTYLVGLILVSWLGCGVLVFLVGIDLASALSYTAFAVLGLAGLVALTFADVFSMLSKQALARDKDLARNLPFVIDFLVMIMASGGTFMSALNLYMQHGSPSALKKEFFLVLQEIRAGETRAVALQRLAERAPLDEVRRLVLVMAQAERMGTPVTEVLRKQSMLLRMERTQKATETAEEMNVEARLYVGGMIMALMLVIAGPFIIITLRSTSMK